VVSLRNGLFAIKIVNKVVSVRDGLAVARVAVTAPDGCCARPGDVGAAGSGTSLRAWF